jgi:hypothetical protein
MANAFSFEPSAMKVVVLTTSGEPLATPTPAELVKLFIDTSKVGINFAKIFEEGEGDSEEKSVGVDDGSGDENSGAEDIRRVVVIALHSKDARGYPIPAGSYAATNCDFKSTAAAAAASITSQSPTSSIVHRPSSLEYPQPNLLLPVGSYRFIGIYICICIAINTLVIVIIRSGRNTSITKTALPPTRRRISFAILETCGTDRASRPSCTPSIILDTSSKWE